MRENGIAPANVNLGVPSGPSNALQVPVIKVGGGGEGLRGSLFSTTETLDRHYYYGQDDNQFITLTTLE